MKNLLGYNGKPKVCFVALENFAALVDDVKFGGIGGAEIQQTIIGRNLVKRGYGISFVTLDHGQDDEMEIDGIRILKAYNKNVGIPVLRFPHPRVTSLWRAMRKADADIYYQRIRDSLTGIVAAFCRWHQRKFVFAVAGDYDCVPDPPGFPARHVHVLYYYGLRRADLVIAQTATQQRLLRDNFGIDSTVIPNCAPDYRGYPGGTDVPTSDRRRRLLWIGGFSPVKRLELLLDIAERHRDLQFDVVGGGNSESKYVQRLQSRAESMPNVHLHGVVPHARMGPFYQRAAALICTSRSEGFPNTFLEAWSYGLPVVSTFDPDNLITEHGLGVVAKDLFGLVDGLRIMLDCQQRWREAAQTARQYYRNNHSVEAVIPRFENAFMSVANGPESGHSHQIQQ